MRPSPKSCESRVVTIPKPIWLKLASMALGLALRVFAASEGLGRPAMVEWLAVRILRVAGRWLGHAPTEYCVEFRADLPVEI